MFVLAEFCNISSLKLFCCHDTKALHILGLIALEKVSCVLRENDCRDLLPAQDLELDCHT